VTRRRRVLLIALGCVVVLAAAVAITLPRYARSYIEREARRRGIELQFQSLELGLRRVRLRGVRFSLAGVRGMSGTMETVSVDIAGLTPQRVEGEGLTLELEGTSFVPGVIGWARALPSGAALPTSASVAEVRWQTSEGIAHVSGGTLAVGPEPSGGEAGSLLGGRVRLGDSDLGAVDVAFVVGADPSGATPSLGIGLGSAKVASAPVRIEVRGAVAGAPVRITVDPLPAAAIAGTAGVVLPSTRAVIGAAVELPLPDLERPAPIAGTVALTIDGWVPPHPKELDGIVFGDRTAVDGAFRIADDRRTVDVDDLHVVAGALKLAGTAAARRPSGDAHGHLQADLSGTIACTLLANSAASARLGKTLGDLAGALARRTLTGSVAVRVRLDADTSALGEARIEPSAIVRCKVRGL